MTANLKQPKALTELLTLVDELATNHRGEEAGKKAAAFLNEFIYKYPAEDLVEVTAKPEEKVSSHSVDMVASAHQIIYSMLNGPGVMLTAEQNDAYMAAVSKDASLFLLKMEAFMAVNHPADVSYPMFVGNLFKQLDTPVMSLWHAATGCSTEAGELLDNVKKQAIYGKQLNDIWDKETGQTVVQNLLEELGDQMFYMQAIMNMFGWTIDDVILSNRMKLGKRYSEGKYTDKAANERADKN